jgi:L-rhamnose isomerase
MRYPKEFQLGAFTNPDPALRQKAVELTLEAGQWALELGAEELVVWSAFDGYDYNLQVDHLELWRQVVDAFQQVRRDQPQHPNKKIVHPNPKPQTPTPNPNRQTPNHEPRHTAAAHL